MSSNAKVAIIGCIPVSMAPTPPADQEDCQKQGCEVCSTAVWVSVKKRTLKKLNPDYIIMCMHCCVIAADVMKDGNGTVEVRNIGSNDKS